MQAYQLVQHVAIRNIVMDENSPFDINPLKEELQGVSGNQSAFETIRNFDISRMIFPHTLNQTFPCHFFKGNLGWMSVSEGHYRYFSKSYNGRVQFFDLFDLLSAYYETHSREVMITNLLSSSKVIPLDRTWRRKQEQRYYYNLNWIDKVKELSPIAHIAIKPHVDIYKTLNEEGFRHLGPMFLSVEKEAIFFASARYLSDKIGMSDSKVSKVIIYLEELGLLERVKDEDIPDFYLNKSMEMKGKGKNRINYYRMTDMRLHEADVIAKCEEYAMKGIRYTTRR